MISLWKLREKKNVAQMPFVKNTPETLITHKNFNVTHGVAYFCLSRL